MLSACTIQRIVFLVFTAKDSPAKKKTSEYPDLGDSKNTEPLWAKANFGKHHARAYKASSPSREPLGKGFLIGAVVKTINTGTGAATMSPQEECNELILGSHCSERRGLLLQQ